MNNSVPEEWESKPLSDLTSLITKGATPTTYGHDYVGSLSDGGARFVRGNNATLNGSFVGGDVKYICKDANAQLKRSQLHVDDIVISIVGSVGASFRVEESIVPANINQNVALVRPGNKLGSAYLAQVVVSDVVQEQIANEVTVQAQPSLSLKQVGDFIVPLPPLPEQQKIAAILTSVDNVIESTQAQINKLQDLKTGMMQELLTQGVCDENGKRHSEFKDSPVGRIPVGWDVKPLGAVLENIIDCEHKTAPYVEQSDYMVVRTNNVKGGILLHDDMKFTTKNGFEEWTKRSEPSAGDILFTREAPAGESCMVPAGINVCMGQRMVLLKPIVSEINGKYLSIYLNSDIAKLIIYELSIGTTVSRINIQDIKKINCIVPPLDEQIEIMKAIESAQTATIHNEQKLKAVITSKKALMQDLLTGKVRVAVPTHPCDQGTPAS
jgi:type I restriction enzyme S subunit